AGAHEGALAGRQGLPHERVQVQTGVVGARAARQPGVGMQALEAKLSHAGEHTRRFSRPAGLLATSMPCSSAPRRHAALMPQGITWIARAAPSATAPITQAAGWPGSTGCWGARATGAPQPSTASARQAAG